MYGKIYEEHFSLFIIIINIWLSHYLSSASVIGFTLSVINFDKTQNILVYKDSDLFSLSNWRFEEHLKGGEEIQGNVDFSLKAQRIL